MNKKCDCLNDCGDDPNLKTGKVERCDSWKAAQRKEQAFYDNLPEISYTAYCEQTGWKSADTGADLPDFADIPDDVKSAWKASAYALAKFLGYRRQYL